MLVLVKFKNLWKTLKSFPPFGARKGPHPFNMTPNKKKIKGYLICHGEIQFVNYLNKVVKIVEIKKVLERWREEIEKMAIET